MDLKNFEEVIVDKTGGNKKFKTDEYLAEGVLPIIDQGQKFIAGYTNNNEAKASVKLPCIVFGDHTKIFKYVDFPFALGADGTKVLETINGADAKYLYYYFSQTKLPGKEGYKRNFKYLKEIKVPLPDLKTQQEIAQVLEQADKARQQRKAANALTDQFLQSSFLSLFGDPVKNEKGWEVKKIGDFTPTILSGKSVQSESRSKDKNEFGVLKVSAVTYGVFKPEEHKAIINGFVPDDSITPKKGDILFSRANTKELVAATCIVDKDYPDLFLPDKLWKVNIDRTVVNEWFFKYVLSQQSYRNKLSEKSTGTSGSMFNISKEKLIDFNFPIPPLSLQQQFAGIVAQAEQLRQKQRESERELETLFQALLQRYFG